MLKVETLKLFSGFSEDLKNTECYFSLGMRLRGGVVEPAWKIVECARSSTRTSLDLINSFAERYESPHEQIYAHEEAGDILKCQDELATAYVNWSLAHTCSTSSSGNGLIVDHSSSQRLLYIQDEWVGSYDGVVWYDTFMDLGWSLAIPKPADIYEDWVVIANGSTVALLNITDDSKTYNAFNFPPDFIGKDVKSGKEGVLLGANFNQRGVLALWDCIADRSIAPWLWIDRILGMAKYQGIWVVATGKNIILTNGYSILRTYEPPDISFSGTNFAPQNPHGMIVDGDRLLIARGSSARFDRAKSGMFVLDLITGSWEFIPASTGNTYDSILFGAMFKTTNNNKYISYADSSLSPAQDYIGKITDSPMDISYIISNPIGDSSPTQKELEAVILKLGHSLRHDTVYSDPDWNIQIKAYNFKRLLWARGAAASTAAIAIQIPVDGTVNGYNIAEIGDEITVMEGLNAGVIRHIADISYKGTIREMWTLDTALSSAIKITEEVNVSPFKKIGEKKINTANIKDDRLYVPIKNKVLGRRFLIKIVVDRNEMVPNIEQIAGVYNDLGYQ